MRNKLINAAVLGFLIGTTLAVFVSILILK